ncbi:PLP-dependent transferase [Lactarius akahatsu]|uniref:PLP-dependent transferase n=1 Tax=Lactarius akahatsu TaxID=416441 RepID=A0AAD4LDV9_9AGAM|nr:PLP-dependent transferase [Lactarius akahatsu]
MTSLAQKLASALASRDDRNIRRRLPSPDLSLSHPPITGSATEDPATAASAEAVATTGIIAITTTSASTPVAPSAAPGPAPTPADFSSNDYLSLATSPLLRARVLAALHAAPAILGSGGSRLLVHGTAHAALEARLAREFRSPAALLFNSGFDANAGFFACVPQAGDALVHDAAIHASVHDGARTSRIAPGRRRAFAHNDVRALRNVLCALRDECAALRTGTASVFVAVESVYSMDGTVAPLCAMLDTMDAVFPAGNAHMVVDEAHATGLYGPGGRGLVALLGVEKRVLARLHTFGKALAASGAVLLTNTLIRDYLLNYARPLIYTTSLSNLAVIAASCSFDLLEDGTAYRLAARVLDHSVYFQERLCASLVASSIPPRILSLPAHLQNPLKTQLPTPIIPILTPRARALSAHLLTHGVNARPITWPTVPKGTDRVRVCLHAGNTRAELDRLVDSAIAWAAAVAREEGVGQDRGRLRIQEDVRVMGTGGGGGLLLQSKL